MQKKKEKKRISERNGVLLAKKKVQRNTELQGIGITSQDYPLCKSVFFSSEKHRRRKSSNYELSEWGGERIQENVRKLLRLFSLVLLKSRVSVRGRAVQKHHPRVHVPIQCDRGHIRLQARELILI